MNATHEIAGETLVLLPQLAAYWPRRRTLLVADPHFGKSATFRAEGLPVPSGTTASAIDRLDLIMSQQAVARVVFLGDFMHASQGRTARTLDALARWRERWREVDMLLVRGNHDRHAGDPPVALAIDCAQEPVLDPPFAFRHMPRATPGSYTLAGHTHPAALLHGGGRQRLRLPCFWFTNDVCTFPAFGDFTGSADIAAGSGDAVFVIADGNVVRV